MTGKAKIIIGYGTGRQIELHGSHDFLFLRPLLFGRLYLIRDIWLYGIVILVLQRRLKPGPALLLTTDESTCYSGQHNNQ
jgi:hypothetical protein